MPGSPRLQAWIDGGEMRRLAGHAVFTRTAVTAGRPPLLLIHGYPTASYDWARVWPRLAKHYSLYALDMLGFGLSAKPRGCDYPIALQADLCMALLEAEGVGEVLRPIELPARWYLVIYPGCPVNTAGIFKDPQLTRSTPEITMAAFLGGHGHNDCEPVASRMNPEIARALAWLASYGTARMSGTGSAVFAAFEDEQAAQEAAAAVPMEWTRFVALGLDRSPVHSALGL